MDRGPVRARVEIGTAVCERHDHGARWWLPAEIDRAPLVAASAAGIGGWELDDDGSLWIQARETLAGRLGDTPWAWTDAVALARRIAAVLVVAEARGIAIDPLTPSTIELVGERVILRADGWLARMCGAETHAPASTRLSRWMAPEQADGGAHSPSTCRYALGLVLYRLLAGAHPFAGKGLRLGLDEAAARGPTPLPEAVAAALPAGLHALVLRCLAPDPAARPAHAQAIAARLAELHAPVPETRAITPTFATAIAPAPAPVPAPVARQRPGLGGSVRATILALPLVAGIVYGLALADESRPAPPPARPTIHARAALGAGDTRPDDCGACHPDAAAQWHLSVMAHAVKSPLFQALEILIQEQGGREFGCDGGAGLLRPSDGRTACRDRTTGVEVTGSGGALWCVNCHAPGENVRAAVPAWDGLDPRSPSHAPLASILPASTMDGISCVVCHEVHGPVQPGDALRGRYEGNPDWISTATGQRFSARPEDRQGVFGIANSGYALDPDELLAGAPSPRDVPGGAHRRPSAAARAYLRSSEFCGGCHDVRLFGTDVIGGRRGEHFKRLRNAYSEWAAWADDERARGREPASCQDCHMSAFPGVCEPSDDGASVLGQIAAGNTALARACPPGTRLRVRAPGVRGTAPVATSSGTTVARSSHYFSGVDVPLSPAFDDALVDDTTLDGQGIPLGARARRDLLLGATFRFEIDGAARRGRTLEIPIVLENVGAGHRVPAGFSQEREFWVHLVVKDARGRTIYEVGRVDGPADDLHDKRFVRVNVDDDVLDADGRPLGLFGADVVDGPDALQWDPSPHTGATLMRGRGLVNLQNGFLRCVTCIGIVDGAGRCQPGPGQGFTRADRFADGIYDPDTGTCTSNLVGDEALFETYFPVGALDAERGLLKAPDAIIDTRSAPPHVPLRYVYELDDGGGQGPFEVEARLLFRAFPPFLVAAFADYEARMAARGRRPDGPLVTRAMLDRLEVVELHRLRATIP